jgi:hypothetical protein
VGGKDTGMGWMTGGRWPTTQAIGLLAMVLVGCSGVDSAAKRQIAEQRLPRPDMILVHDFAVSPEQLVSHPSISYPWVESGQTVMQLEGERIGIMPPQGAEVGAPVSRGPRLVRDPRTAGERAVGARFARAFSATLVDEIRKMGLPAELAVTAGPNLPGTNLLAIEGRFVSLAGDPDQPGIVGFSGDHPEVEADLQIYGTDSAGERLYEDTEVGLTGGNAPLPAALLADPTITVGQIDSGAVKISADLAAKLDAAGREAAGTVAQQLATFFANQGWITANAAGS